MLVPERDILILGKIRECGLTLPCPFSPLILFCCCFACMHELLEQKGILTQQEWEKRIKERVKIE
jgi:hypothetical protein